MKLKLAVFAMLIALLWQFKPRSLEDVEAISAADAVSLVPEKIGAFERQPRTWRIPHHDGVIEEGAMYSLPAQGGTASIPVQLDFYRHARYQHNGLACYLNVGEVLRWSERKDISPTVQLLLSLTQAEHQLRLVATTECYVDHCNEQRIATTWTVQMPDWAPLQAHYSKQRGVVPMSIVLTADVNDANQHEVEQTLRTQMARFLADVDFNPAIRVAALQTAP
ncbi:hypothetical protein ACO0K2_02260 [Undibacterium sp. MH2W]|uniref:hypothetical protein n=1 Tax=Undibacterium sp. MH2W TaxID=3413044 RepID=UPI003BF3DBEB